MKKNFNEDRKIKFPKNLKFGKKSNENKEFKFKKSKK